MDWTHIIPRRAPACLTHSSGRNEEKGIKAHFLISPANIVKKDFACIRRARATLCVFKRQKRFFIFLGKEKFRWRSHGVIRHVRNF